MSEKLKNLLVKILFRWLDAGGSDIADDDKEITRWLSTSAQDIGCIRYIQARERALIRGLLIDGLAPMPRDSFVRKSGQRFELHAFMTRIRRQGQIAEERRRRKIQETE